MKKKLTLSALAIVIAGVLFFACKKSGTNDSLFSGPDKQSSSLNTLLTCNYVTLSGALSTQTLSNTNIYKLDGIVRIPSGVTVTIPAGTVLQGIKSATTAWLVVEKGGKLIATGTSSSPIVFTSDQAAGSRATGDWGGIVIAGQANNNSSNSLDIPLSSTYTVNGGGTNNTDNSGNLQFIQVHFAGKGYIADPSKTGLILNSVGTGTAIDHVQVNNPMYDGVGVFGGLVRLTNMISYNAGRTDYSISYGYQGNMQYIAAMRMNNAAVPALPAYGLDISNQPTVASGNAPTTQPVISNLTVLGPNYCNGTTVNSNFKNSVHYFNNGAGKIYNSVFSSFNTGATQSGLLIEGAGTVAKTVSNELQFSYNSFHASGTTPYGTTATWSGSGCGTTMAGWIDGTGTIACREAGNQFSVATLGYDGSFCSDYCAGGFSQNFVLGTTSLSAANFTWDTGSAFSHATYRGAFGASDFTSGWTNWCGQNVSYCQ